MRSLTISLLTLAALAGCGKKGESAKMRDLYHCWEIGWQIVESCYSYGRDTECKAWADDWFESTNTGVTMLDSNKAFASDREKCAQDAVRGATVWNKLSPEDISDDMAATLETLQTAVKKKDIPGIRSARARVRQLLDMAP